MFESKREKPLPRHLFIRRMAKCLGLAAVVIAAGVSLGLLGYHFIAGLGWVDAFLEAAMILTGMGPVAKLDTTAAKLFSSFFALFSGLVFLSVVAITVAPVLHRVLHKFHIDEDDLKRKK
jgi:hypothetical protein